MSKLQDEIMNDTRDKRLISSIMKDKKMTDVKSDIQHDVSRRNLPDGIEYENQDVRIVNIWSKTRNGFKHTSHLFINNRDIGSVKNNYYNRTWESYEYETVMKNLHDKFKNELTESQNEQFDEIIRKGR